MPTYRLISDAKPQIVVAELCQQVGPNMAILRRGYLRRAASPPAAKITVVVLDEVRVIA